MGQGEGHGQGGGHGAGHDVTNRESLTIGSSMMCLIICCFVFISIPLLVAGIVMVTILGLSDNNVYIAGIVLTVIGGILVLVLFIIIILICTGIIGSKKTEPDDLPIQEPEPAYPAVELWSGAYGTETLGFREDNDNSKVHYY